jgi:hypothetical protein
MHGCFDALLIWPNMLGAAEGNIEVGAHVPTSSYAWVL